jgi:superfamily II DNA or RNA helicase
MTAKVNRHKWLRLRGYQRSAVDVVDDSHERALIVAACGTGKTR